jgi:hypothetical protein
MWVGDLVESTKYKSIGVVVEIFDDLSVDNPWIRVLFTTPIETFQWIKKDGLKILKKEKKKGGLNPPSPSKDAAMTGSL